MSDLTYTEYRRAYGNSIIYACGDYVSRSFSKARTQQSVKQESHGFNRVECQSVEDAGSGVCFNVYCYNAQPGVTIDYKTGESKLQK